MNPLDLIPGWFKLALVTAAVAGALGLYTWRVHVERETGRAEVQMKWDASVSQQRAAAFAESESNAKETLRRLEKQKENQDANDKLLATARADAARNAADAERLRAQSADTARRWSDALSNSPTASQCAAAGAAITVQADVLGRMDRAAGELAAFADASRAAGLKCQSDYQSLMPP